VVSIYKDFVRSGGLIAYCNIVYRRAAHFLDKLRKRDQGRKVPVEQPVIFDVIINQRRAKALGIAIPQSVLFRAPGGSSQWRGNYFANERKGRR
jgi:ABC-type uncharacterized transport system substrate-binding protein